MAPGELECFGGPLDHQRVSDRGVFFKTLPALEVIGDGKLVSPAFPSGTYERRGHAYYWRADEG
jgi:hypothetical protein